MKKTSIQLQYNAILTLIVFISGVLGDKEGVTDTVDDATDEEQMFM